MNLATDLPAEPAQVAYEGLLTMNPKGFGFVRIGGGLPDVFIPPAETGGAIQGERVRVTATVGDDGRAIGTVIEVLASPDPRFIARVAVAGSEGQYRILAPLDTRLPNQIRLPQGTELPVGTLVQARLTVRPNGHIRAQAEIETGFGPDLTTEVAVALALAQHDIAQVFPPAVLAEAAAFPIEPTVADAQGRWDLRHIPLVTIDGASTRDFDDAVYAEPHPEGFRLLVAIADVAHYVQEGSALDAEAARRTTSVYLPGKVIPMLPEALSNGLCSLNPDVDRLCMVAELIVQPDGRIGATQFANAIMRSAARLTYTGVSQYLAHGEGDFPKAIQVALGHLQGVYQALAVARTERGALEFETPEVRFTDIEGGFAPVEDEPRTEAHKLIEECMIAANVAVAQRLIAEAMPAPYRVHTLHSPDRHAEFQAWAAAQGWALPAFEATRAPDLKALLAQVGDHPLRPALIAQIRRLQGQASYATLNAGHFGLALDAYTHFTSPIRRYPDLLVHRALKRVIAGQAASAAPLDALALACVEGERRAMAAERQVVDYQRAGFLTTQVGTVYTGTVSGHTPMGVFVLFGPQASSLLGSHTLEGAIYDALTRTWHTAEGEVCLPVGSAVRIRLVRVDADRARLYIDRAMGD